MALAAGATVATWVVEGEMAEMDMVAVDGAISKE